VRSREHHLTQKLTHSDTMWRIYTIVEGTLPCFTGTVGPIHLTEREIPASCRSVILNLSPTLRTRIELGHRADE
jgi:hypothetical protein